MSNIPVQHIREFQRTRSEVINADKVTTIKLQKVVAMKSEATALLAITQKAAMKYKIKKTGAGQRDIATAQQMARDVARELAGLLAELRNPKGLAPKPGAVTTSKNRLVGAAGNKTFFDHPTALGTARGYWKNVDTAYKLMTTKAKNMETVLANRKKGFRSTELTDSIVKAEMAKAAKSVKDAKADIKAVDADYKAAKKAIAKLEAEAKKRKITR